MGIYIGEGHKIRFLLILQQSSISIIHTSSELRNQCAPFLNQCLRVCAINHDNVWFLLLAWWWAKSISEKETFSSQGLFQCRCLKMIWHTVPQFAVIIKNNHFGLEIEPW